MSERQKKVTLSLMADCATDSSCSHLKLMRPRFERDVQTMWGIKRRTFVRVKSAKGEVLADIKTGHLYREDGTCLSSVWLKLVPTADRTE